MNQLIDIMQSETYALQASVIDVATALDNVITAGVLTDNLETIRELTSNDQGFTKEAAQLADISIEALSLLAGADSKIYAFNLNVSKDTLMADSEGLKDVLAPIREKAINAVSKFASSVGDYFDKLTKYQDNLDKIKQEVTDNLLKVEEQGKTSTDVVSKNKTVRIVRYHLLKNKLSKMLVRVDTLSEVMDCGDADAIRSFVEDGSAVFDTPNKEFLKKTVVDGVITPLKSSPVKKAGSVGELDVYKSSSKTPFGNYYQVVLPTNIASIIKTNDIPKVHAALKGIKNPFKVTDKAIGEDLPDDEVDVLTIKEIKAILGFVGNYNNEKFNNTMRDSTKIITTDIKEAIVPEEVPDGSKERAHIVNWCLLYSILFSTAAYINLSFTWHKEVVDMLNACNLSLKAYKSSK